MGGDWWFWGLLLFVVILNLVIILGCTNNEQTEHVRRLSDWYQGRYSTYDYETDERRNLSGHSQEEPSPPLYQTIVSPTYQYQKPPTPREPPPKYEEEGTESAAPSSVGGGGSGNTNDNVDASSSGEPDSSTSPAEGEETQVGRRNEDCSRRRKLTSLRLTPLINHIRGLRDQNKSVVGESMFARSRSRNSDVSNNKTDVEGAVPNGEECLVYEFRLEPPATSSTVESH